mgnify:CR=1 FL=1
MSLESYMSCKLESYMSCKSELYAIDIEEKNNYVFGSLCEPNLH